MKLHLILKRSRILHFSVVVYHALARDEYLYSFGGQLSVSQHFRLVIPI